MKVMSIFGTRPEAIKMAPVVKAIQCSNAIQSEVCVTGQHREMLDQMLGLFEIDPDVDLNVMQHGQSLTHLSTVLINKISLLLEKRKPDLILVHGDTTTAFTAALAAFYHKIPVGHVEAGLRSHDRYAPWPEEMNRNLVGTMASFHFAPTVMNKQNLLRENIAPEAVFVTGNTVIDALFMIKERIEGQSALREKLRERFSFLDASKRIILVTGHRRENWGQGLENTFMALRALALRGDVQIMYPVHPNRAVQEAAFRCLGGCQNIHLIAPLDYIECVYLMSACYLIITDSGGIQEEAPALGKPVLVTREITERSEGIVAGTAKLVGTNLKKIVSEASILLDNEKEYEKMAKAINPYGDGTAAKQIIRILEGSPLCRFNQPASLV